MALNSVEQTVLRRVKQANEGSKPLHIFKFNWPIQVSTIQAECVSIRKLTLLEEFTLRAFNEIEGVDAAQIAEELGLEAKLIEETLDNLMASQAIEAQLDDTYNSSDVSELREEISNLEAEIDQASHRLQWRQRLSNKPLRSKKNKLKLAKARLSNLEAKDSTTPQGTSWFAKLRNAWNVMRNFTAIVTPRGKENLAKGLIDMPAKTISMHLCRCPISGLVFPMKDILFRREDLVKLDSESYIVPYDIRKMKPVDGFSDSDVKTAFERGRSLESEVEIRSQVMKDEHPIVEALLVYSVLILNKDGQHVWSIMRAKQNQIPKTLTWAEEELNRNTAMQDKLLHSLGNSKSKNQVKISNMRPVQATKNDMLEIVNKARTIIIRDPLQLDETEFETLENAISGAAVFEINNTGSGKPSVKSEQPLRVSVSTNAIQSSGIFSEFGHVRPGFVRITSGSKNYKIAVNEVSHQPTVFSSLQDDILPKLSPNIRFRMSQSEADFREWVDFEMDSVQSLDEFDESVQKLQAAGSTMSFSIENIIGERLREIMTRIVDTTDDAQLLQVQHLSDTLKLKIWDSVAVNIQSSMLVDGQHGDCLKVWQQHKTKKKLLSHEDAARLEDYLFASCDQTAIHVKRSFEKSLRSLAKENEVITGGDLSMVIDELHSAKIINPKMKKSAHDVRKIRNRFIHTEDRTATLNQVLMSITVTRKIRSMLTNEEQTEYWAEPQGTQWDEVLDEEELKQSILDISHQCERFSKLDLPLDGNIWTSPIFNRIPSEFKDFNHEVLEVISSIPEFSTGPPFSTIAVEIAKRSMKGFLSKHNPENLAFPASMIESLHVLNELGLEDVTKQILSDVITTIPRPTRSSELLHEASNSEFIDGILKQEILTTRWYSAIRDKGFICNFEELSTGDQSGFARLPKKAREGLLDKAIRAWRDTLKRGEFEALQPLSEQLHLMQANGWPGIAAGDGRLENAVRRQLATNDNPQAVARKLSELHNENNPLFPEHLKKCNKHITDFINKNKEEKE